MIHRRIISLGGILFLSIAQGCFPKTSPSNSTQTGITHTATSAQTPSTVSSGFRNVAKEAGLDYQWTVQGKRPLNILQTIGNGAAFLDYNNDGNLDILLVSLTPALFMGDGKGHFIDTTETSGLKSLKGHFLGCAVGDVNSDGYSDIYLTAYRGGILLQNNAGKGFKDVTASAKLPAIAWGTSATFFDLDKDRQLDLYVCNYAKFGPKTLPQLCKYSNYDSACGPRFYQPEKGILFQNNQGKFNDVTASWKGENVQGKGLGVIAADTNGKGLFNIIIANDEVAGDFLIHQGKQFSNQAVEAGTAYDSEGSVHGGMGTDCGDINNDGKLDLFVATFQNEVKCLYLNEGNNLFTEIGASAGLQASKPYVTFGAKFFDFNNDGKLDIVLANGHVQDNINAIDKTAEYKQPIQIFQNQDGKLFTDASLLINEKDRTPIVGRGLATGDYDNDGKIDVLVVDSEGSPILLHNESKDIGNFITLALSGVKSNRDAYGAIVTVEADGKKITEYCHSDGSYLSASDKRVHIGIGSATEGAITIQWPSGAVQKFSKVLSNKFYKVTEGNPKMQ
jgi:enediyne biosynthesis protein E4